MTALLGLPELPLPVVVESSEPRRLRVAVPYEVCILIVALGEDDPGFVLEYAHMMSVAARDELDEAGKVNVMDVEVEFENEDEEARDAGR